MSLKSSVQFLLENLVEQTIQLRTIWNPISDRTLQVEIDDVKFEFSVTWKLELNTGYTMSNGFLTLRSSDFDLTIYTTDYPDIMGKLKEFFYNSYFYSKKPSDKNLLDKIDNITKKLSIEEYRDKKIDSILDK